MSQEHSKSNITLLINQFPIILKDLDIFQFGAVLRDKRSVVQLQFTLFDGLHACNGAQKLRTARNPENRVHVHWCAVTQALLAGWDGDYFLSLSIDSHKHHACDAGRHIAGDSIKVLLDRLLGLLVDHLIQVLCGLF